MLAKDKFHVSKDISGKQHAPNHAISARPGTSWNWILEHEHLGQCSLCPSRLMTLSVSHKDIFADALSVARQF